MSQPFIGEIFMFAGTFAPRDYMFCDGAVLPIAQNTALFSLLGTTYGGNGQTTFALPDLRGRLPLNQGQGPGLSNYVIGQQSGTPTVTLTAANLPAHTHGVSPGAGGAATSPTPVGNVPAVPASGTPYAATGAAKMAGNLAAGTTGTSGNSLPHENMMPYLGVNFIIAIFGIYPSRN